MFFLSRYSRNLGKRIKGISQATTDRLVNYSWPGNVRELQNVIERALILSRGPILELDADLPLVTSPEVLARTPQHQAQHIEAAPLALPTLQEVERAHILVALKQTRGVIEGPNGAAKALNLHPNTLRHRMDKLGIKRSAHRIS